MKSFADLKLSAPLARAIEELGYVTPTDVQAQALPILLAGGGDFIGQAATGTGKTAAFGIPLLEQIDPAVKHVQGLVMCPTRELALQVAGQLDLLGKYKGIKALPVYGGAGYGPQLEGMKRGAAIVVGTPGRLIDHLERRSLVLKHVKTVVLDEADEMISMGFKEELETILKGVPRETSHIWLFSATMSKEVRRVADAYLRKPRQVQINRTEMLSTTVEQVYFPVREGDKPETLCKIIETADDFYGLVFCQTKKLVMDLTEYLLGRGYKVDSLHGDKTQEDRERTMRAFREKKVNLLVCTDVASRGLDVKELTHVINYTIPKELDVYVHRIGRTARSGKAGIAISLMVPTHRYLISRIEHMTKSKMKVGTLPSREDVARRKVSKVLAQFLAQKDLDRAMAVLGEDWQAATESLDLQEIIARFLMLLSPETFSEAPAATPASLHGPKPHARRPSN